MVSIAAGWRVGVVARRYSRGGGATDPVRGSNLMPTHSPRVIPRDIPRDAAARRMGLTGAEFQAALPSLIARGFPDADPTTGLYDLEAIDAWARARNPHLFGLTL